MAIVNHGSEAGTTRNWEAEHEAARLFPQQRGLPGENSVEPERVNRRSIEPSPAQGRAAVSDLSRDQPAGAGSRLAGRQRRNADPVARDYRMAGRNSPLTAALAETGAASRPCPRLCASDCL